MTVAFEVTRVLFGFVPCLQYVLWFSPSEKTTECTENTELERMRTSDSEPTVTRKITGVHIESCYFCFGFGSVLSVYSVVKAQKLTTEHTENTEQETEHE